MKLLSLLGAATVVAGAVTQPKSLDIQDPRSIRDVAATIAFDAMSYYKGNTSSVPKDLGDLQDPYYWWVAGALWGTMLDYFYYTGDTSYNDVVTEALLAPTNIGPDHNYMPPEHADEEGNDDLFFWGSAVISAAERNFPQPRKDMPSWLDIGANVFNQLAGRWNMSHCGGGLNWQIYPQNPNGMNYKNSVSNGGFFQLAARLARATGNSTYQEWAEKIWDWSWDVNFIDHDAYHIYDGASSSDNCAKTNQVSFTYTSGIYLYGAAIMANHTGSDEWETRTERLLGGADWFFTPYKNATNVLFEAACERVGSCSVDMSTHKGTLSRFLWQTAVLVPSLRSKIEKFMRPSSEAAAKSCTGGESGTTCGLRWYTGGYDNNPGLGQQMSALETIQGLLSDRVEPPLRGKDIKVVRAIDWESLAKSALKNIVAGLNTIDNRPKGGDKDSDKDGDKDGGKKKKEDDDSAAVLLRADPLHMGLAVGAALLVSVLF